MYLVALAWTYVVLMMAIVEATAPQGTLLGAVFTLLLYGVVPLAIVLYIVGTPGRRRALRAAEREREQAPSASAAPLDPDGSGHAAGQPVAAEGKEA